MPITEPIHLSPIRFADASPTLRIWPDSAGAGSAQNVTLDVSAGVDYWWSGTDDVRAGLADLALILEEALNTNTDGETFTVALSARNVVTITAGSGDTFQILWTHVGTTVTPAVFGWTLSDVTSSGAGVLTAPYQAQGCWIPGTSSRAVGMRTDTRREPVAVSVMAESIDGASRGYQLTSSLGERRITYHMIERERVLTEYAASGEPYGTLEWNWETGGWVRGAPMLFFEDRSTRTTSNGTLWRMKPSRRPWSEMAVSRIQRYEVDLPLREVTMPSGAANAYSVDFDGVDEYVAITDHADFDSLTTMTISMWVYFDSVATGQTLISKWRTTTMSTAWILQTVSTNDLRCWVSADAATDNGANYGDTSTLNITSTAWHHVVVVFDGSGAGNSTRLRLWVDGTEYTLSYTGTIPATLTNSAADIRIGANQAFGRYLPGQVDEVAIYNAALSAAQIAALYNSGSPPVHSDLDSWDSALCWLRMGDGDTFPLLLDARSGGGAATAAHHGTMTNQESGDIVSTVP